MKSLVTLTTQQMRSILNNKLSSLTRGQEEEIRALPIKAYKSMDRALLVTSHSGIYKEVK